MWNGIVLLSIIIISLPVVLVILRLLNVLQFQWILISNYQSLNIYDV